MLKHVEYSIMYLQGHLAGIKSVHRIYTSFPERIYPGKLIQSIQGDWYVVCEVVVE